MSENDPTELLKNIQRRFGVDIRVSTPASKSAPNGKDKKALTSLGRKVLDLRDKYGLTLEELTNELNQRLGTRLAQTSVYNWYYSGATPRKVNPDTIERTLDAIMSEREAVAGGVWVDASEVAEAVARWREHLSVRQIAIAADEHPSTVRSWSTGYHRVLRSKWERVVPKIEEAANLTSPGQEE